MVGSGRIAKIGGDHTEGSDDKVSAETTDIDQGSQKAQVIKRNYSY